jgi:hypothetical protein
MFGAYESGDYSTALDALPASQSDQKWQKLKLQFS